MGFIYKIENLINNKVYIGLTTQKNPYVRFHQHLKAAKSNKPYLIHQAIRKYGSENFSFKVIEEVDDKNLNEREIYWISQYDSYHNGYNMTPGGKAPKKEKYCKVSDKTILDTYFSSNENGAETARQLDISEDTVYRRLKEYNIQARDRHSIAVQINKNSKKKIWQVDIITLQVVKEWDSISSARALFKLDTGALEAKRSKSSHGFFWCYANQESYNLLLSRVKNYKPKNFNSFC